MVDALVVEAPTFGKPCGETVMHCRAVYVTDKTVSHRPESGHDELTARHPAAVALDWQ